jgi:hypothetical protein
VRSPGQDACRLLAALRKYEAKLETVVNASKHGREFFTASFCIFLAEPQRVMDDLWYQFQPTEQVMSPFPST